MSASGFYALSAIAEPCLLINDPRELHMKRMDFPQGKTVLSRILTMAAPCVCAFGLLACDANAALPVSVSNPLFVPVPDGGALADPEVIKFRGTYYLYGTSGPSGIRVWSSRNLVNWQHRGIAASRQPLRMPGTAGRRMCCITTASSTW
jgi:hypothetical protein